MITKIAGRNWARLSTVMTATSAIHGYPAKFDEDMDGMRTFTIEGAQMLALTAAKAAVKRIEEDWKEADDETKSQIFDALMDSVRGWLRCRSYAGACCTESADSFKAIETHIYDFGTNFGQMRSRVIWNLYEELGLED